MLCTKTLDATSIWDILQSTLSRSTFYIALTNFFLPFFQATGARILITKMCLLLTQHSSMREKTAKRWCSGASKPLPRD